MSQPILNSSFSGINFAGMNRGSRLSYTSLRAASGDNSINEEERLSTPNVHTLSGSPRGSLTMEQGSRLSQPDVRRYLLRQDGSPVKRERLSQPTLVTGDYYPGRGQQRLSQPCLSSGKELILPSIHSPSPLPLKHKRFSPAVAITQRERLSQLDIGAKYRNLKDNLTTNSTVKFNRDRFSIPELETQNDLRLMAGTPKQRFSLDSQLTRNQDSGRSRLLPIASSPISEHQQTKFDEVSGITSGKLKSPTCEGLESVIVASTSPIFPPGERQFLTPDFGLSKQSGKFAFLQAVSTQGITTQIADAEPTTTSATQTKTTPTKTMAKPSIPPIPTRERMSVPEIRNSSLRRLLDPPGRQRHSITGNLRQCLLSPGKAQDIGGRKSPRYSIDDALERFKKSEKKEEDNRRNGQALEEITSVIKETKKQEPKHIQRHYSYTYETGDEGSSILGKISVSALPKKKYLESNFDENEQVITTVIETEIPMIFGSPKYMNKSQVYSSETPKWIRKCLENESPKVSRKTGKDVAKINKRNSRRKSSLESIDSEKKPEKIRSKSVSSGERSPMLKSTGIHPDTRNNIKNTYVRIVPSNNTQENRYEVGVECNWMEDDVQGFYGDECDDTDSDDSTSI